MSGTAADVTTSTLPEPRDPADIRRARDKRRIGLVLLTLFVLAGAAGLFGTKTGHKSAAASGYVVTVTSPQISRPGHAINYEVRVQRAGGFDGPVHMRLS